MAQSVIGNLRVILGLDSAQLMRGAKQAEGRIQKLGSQMRKFGIAIGAVSGGVALAMRGALNAADDAGKLAAKVGLSVEALTRLQFAADLSGVATQSLQAGITRLSRAMVDGNEAFAATGIAARDAAGNIRPTEDVLLDLADVFQRMPDGAEKTALAVQLLGRSGADLIPLLNGGSEALRGMMAEADALGLTISKETFKAAEVFNDSLTRIGAVARGFTLQVMAQLAPALAGMAAALADSAKEGGLVRAVVDGLVNNLARLSTYVAVAVTGLGARFVAALVAARLATLRFSSSLVALRGALIRTGFGALVVGAGELVYQAGRLTTSLGGVGETLSLMKDVAVEVFERIGFGVEAMQSTFRAAGEAIKSALVGAFASALEAFSGLTSGIAEGWNGLMQSIGLESLATARGIGSQLAQSLRTTADLAESNARISNDAAGAWVRAATAPLRSLQAMRERMSGVADNTDEATDAAQRLNGALDEVSEGGGGGGRGPLGRLGEEAEDATEAFQPLETAVGSLSTAVGDFFSRGMSDFKGFRDAIFGGFQKLVSDMIALAAQNKITIALGASGGVAGTAASAATAASGGGVLSGIGGFLASPLGLGVAAAGAGILGILAARRRRQQAERERLERNRQTRLEQQAQILELSGDSAGARDLRRQSALSGLKRGKRRRQEEIFRLEDANRIQEERESIERRILELNGDTVELRKRELAALDPANRALAERAFALEDEARIANERRGLEERLLQLLGDTEELRRREIEALDKSNRGLLQTIFNVEDLTAQFEELQRRLSVRFDLSAKEFLTSFDARFAQATAARDLGTTPGDLATNDPQIRALQELQRKQLKILEDISLFGIPMRS